MKSIIKTSLLASVICVIGSGAIAADLDPVFADDANMFRPAELGSGWYLRGDVSYGFQGNQYEADVVLDDGVNFVRDSDLSERIGYGVGVGYQFRSFLRGDVTVDRSSFAEDRLTGPTTFSGSRTITAQTLVNGELEDVERTVYFDDNGLVTGSTCSVDDVGCPTAGSNTNAITGSRSDLTSYSTWNVLANAYIDLPVHDRIVPYVGAGVGASRINSRFARTVTCNAAGNERCALEGAQEGETVSDFTVFEGSVAKWFPTYSFSAGTGIKVRDNIVVDLGYRYTQTVGVGEFMRDQGAVGVFEDDITNHAVRAGVRFTTW